jgi:hypothetical protein
MGILDDTLSDAGRPLPQHLLRRSTETATSESTESTKLDPEPPADNGDALTVYRLQKDGGSIPPVAPAAPRALAADVLTGRPLHAPVGFSCDASRQSMISIDGLETGKEPVSTWNSDATDRQERLFSPVVSHRLSYGESTRSSISSNQIPFPSDDPGKLVQRIDSSDGMRRKRGRGAPSGDASATHAATMATDRQSGSETADRTAPALVPPANGETAAQSSTGPAAAQASSAPLAAVFPPPARWQAEPSPAAGPGRVDAHAIPASDGAAPQPPGAGRPGTRRSQLADTTPSEIRSQPGKPPGFTPAVGPRLSIGRIEVTVVAAPQQTPAQRPVTDDAFLSKHYLRRL